jgi:hypothetical protein
MKAFYKLACIVAKTIIQQLSSSQKSNLMSSANRPRQPRPKDRTSINKSTFKVSSFNSASSKCPSAKNTTLKENQLHNHKETITQLNL